MFVDFNILNQLGSPSINSNTFANRPAAGQTGRLFVSTDTFEIYRDNGTTWDLIGGPGSSTITGTGTATQVAYFTSSQAIGSSSNLYWDNTNIRLGIGTSTPGTRLDIHGTGIMQHINATGATANSLMAFQRTGTNVWRLGDQYNGGSNYFELHNAALANNAIQIATATNKSIFTSVENYTTGLARANYFDYTLNLPNGTTISSPNAVTTLGATLNLNIAGSATLPNGARSGMDVFNGVNFTSAGTFTINQASTIRAFSNLTSGWAFNGSAVGTITHLAGMRVLFPTNSGTAINVTTNYGLLINDQTANTGTITYTNRWGIYQEGSADLNYFNGNLLIKSTTDNGNALQVTGNSFTSGTVLFGSSSTADAYLRTNTVATTARKGLYLNNGINTAFSVYAGGNNPLGAWSESDKTLVIGTGSAGGGGSLELILFHSTGVGNMFALDAATTRAYLYFPMTASSNISATSFIPTGSTIPTNGMYLSAANTLSFATNSGQRLVVSSAGVLTSINSTGLTRAAISSAGAFIGDTNTANGSSLFVKTGSLSTTFASGLGIDGTYSGGLSRVNIAAIGTQTTGGYASALSILLDNNGTQRTALSIDSDYTLRNNGIIESNVPNAQIAAGQTHTLGWVGISGFSVNLNSSSSFPFVYYTMPNGRLGIGISSPAYMIDVTLPSGSNGEIIRLGRSNGAYNWHLGIDATNSNFNFYNNGNTSVSNINETTGVYTATSDVRVKKDITNCDSAINILEQLQVRKFVWRDTEKTESYGLIAQELFEILPEFVVEGNDNTNWGISRENMVPFLIKAIQELNAEIKALKQK